MNSETVSISALGLNVGFAKWYRLLRGLFIPLLFGVFLLLEITVGILRIEFTSVVIVLAVFVGYLFVTELPDYLGRLGSQEKLLYQCDDQQLRLYLDREYAFNLEKIDAIRAEEGFGPFSQNRIIVEYGGQMEVLETPLKYSPLFRAINLLGKRIKSASGPPMPE
ncbi:hypothetical protein [Halospina sp. K52047b]|uniref:hypothetical protein n=1 Tax=Halospina sp. K52047b TaxID=2614160 RepID=UPI00124AD96E|nr:hypothetical protein [Halospina sp. K52047b]KAA8979314.1 hypothetical protein F3089_13085 [Halospina sp. K52047b]